MTTHQSSTTVDHSAGSSDGQAHPDVHQRPNADTLAAQIELVADGMMRVPEAAHFLGVGKSLLYEMMKQGEVRYAKIHGRRCIPRRALLELAARMLVQPRPG